MKKPPRCACGQILQGRQKVQCAACYIKRHPSSSQCPFCFQWFWSHRGHGDLKTVRHHATAACKKAEAQLVS